MADDRLAFGDDLAGAFAALDAQHLPRPSVRRGPSLTPAPGSLTADALRPLLEHTLLKPTATRSDIDRLCADAIENRFGGVCVNPLWVAHAVDLLAATHVRTITVVGFPLGAIPTASKVAQAEAALSAGASELDMVADLGALRAGDLQSFHTDIRAVVSAAGGVPVKVIIETGLLTHQEKILAALIAIDAGASFLKTSTGFAYASEDGTSRPLGATVEDVALLSSLAPDGVGVKASGGIKSLAQAAALVVAGASRLGTSASLAIVGAT